MIQRLVPNDTKVKQIQKAIFILNGGEELELVKYHNDVNKIKMGTLTERELDLFFSIIFKLKEQNSRSLTLEFKELKQLSDAKVRNNDRLIKTIDGMTDKLIALNSKFILPNGVIRKLNLFSDIEIDPNNSTATMNITEVFSYMLNDFMNGYTKFDLKHLISLKSSYSKQAFRMLKQWDGVNKECWHEKKIDEFREILGVSKNYSTTNFNKKILNLIKQELGEHFNDFEITKLTKNKEEATRGKKAHWLRFTWNTFETKTIEKKEKKINKKEYQEAETIESINLEQAILKAKRNIYVSKSWNKRVDNKLLKLLKDTGEEFTINLLGELYKNLKSEVKTSLVQYINGMLNNIQEEKEIVEVKTKVKAPVKPIKEPVVELVEQSEVNKLKASVMNLGISPKQKSKLFYEISELEDIEKIMEIIGRYI